jgi:hypothetical protein
MTHFLLSQLRASPSEWDRVWASLKTHLKALRDDDFCCDILLWMIGKLTRPLRSSSIEFKSQMRGYIIHRGYHRTAYTLSHSLSLAHFIHFPSFFQGSIALRSEKTPRIFCIILQRNTAICVKKSASAPSLWPCESSLSSLPTLSPVSLPSSPFAHSFIHPLFYFL